MNPLGGWLTVNKQCNLRCRWCYAKGANYENDKEMPLKLAQELTLLMRDIGVQKTILIGGEPTLWKHLFSFNEFCIENKIETALVTNALTFGNDRFYERYQRSPNNHIGISLKAYNRSQMNEVCESQMFNKMVTGLKRLKDTEDAICLTYNSFYHGLLPAMTEFAIDCGYKKVKINFCSATFRNMSPVEEYMIHPKEIVRSLIDDYEILNQITKRQIFFEIMFPFCLFPDDFLNMLIEREQINSVCQLRKRSGIIFDYNGNLLVCNALFDFPIGTYKKDFSTPEELQKHLESDKVLGYHEGMTRYPSEKCVECDKYDICGGGCPLQWSVYQPDEIIGRGRKGMTVLSKPTVKELIRDCHYAG